MCYANWRGTVFLYRHLANATYLRDAVHHQAVRDRPFESKPRDDELFMSFMRSPHAARCLSSPTGSVVTRQKQVRMITAVHRGEGAEAFMEKGERQDRGIDRQSLGKPRDGKTLDGRPTSC